MRIKEDLSYIGLLVLVVLLGSTKIFAQAASDRIPLAISASHKAIKPHADGLLISDRTFLLQSIEELERHQGFKSQSLSMGCSSSISSVGVAESISSDRCPIIDCPAPPPGCSYGPPDTDANGCAINCGQLVCGSEN